MKNKTSNKETKKSLKFARKKREEYAMNLKVQNHDYINPKKIKPELN